MSKELEEVGRPGPSSTPIVLSRNIIPSLAAGLDASDLLECYALVRSAPLHGLANSTLHVQKMAIGIRYRPKVSPTTGQLVKDPRELTLEYGPQRLGPLLNNEAMPFIQVEGTSSFIAWDNVGKVYYTTKIDTDTFISSYYMASMTGAVLEKILLQAVEYTERRRFYQPFNVYSEEHGKEIRSSGSVDFSQFMWQHLANLGVEIEPILPPPLYEARLWVNSVKKVTPEASVSRAAATFYQNLYNCLEAIATNDYSEFEPSPSPTITSMPTSSLPVSLSPTEATIDPTPSPTTVPTSASPIEVGGNTKSAQSPVEVIGNNTSEGSDAFSEDDDDEQETSDDNIESEEDSDGQSIHDATTETPMSSFDDDEDGDGETDGVNDDRHRQARNRQLDDPISDRNNSISYDEISGDNEEDEEEVIEADGEADEAESEYNTGSSVDMALGDSDGSSTSSLDDETQTPTIPASSDNDGTTSGQDVEKAKQAAEEAQQMADVAQDAAQSEGDSKAADAAQAAAHAAKAAADATSNAAAQAAMDNILSGDGAMMANMINICFSNPKYGIASIHDDSSTIASEAYLYRDGTRYYRLNMTKPYLEIARINRPLPKAVSQSQNGSGGDFVDWVLAILVIGMLPIAVLIILQQMGNVYVESLSKCQRWFFNPRKYDYEGESGSDEREERTHHFGEDGIPLSMGGRLSNTPVQLRRMLSSGSDHGSDILSSSQLSEIPNSQDGVAGLGDVELCRVPSRRHSSSGSVASGESNDLELEEIPERILRDPDLVEFPDLKSSSKVAMPVKSNGKRTGRSPYRDSENNQSIESLVSFD